MVQKRKEESEFKVSDRRLFTSDGELRDSTDEQVSSSSATTAVATEQPPAAAAPPVATIASPIASPSFQESSSAQPSQHDPAPESDVPEPPSASEQQAQHDAYRQSARDLDKRVELSGHSAKELEMSFERFMASLYMTAMMQLGLMHEDRK